MLKNGLTEEASPEAIESARFYGAHDDPLQRSASACRSKLDKGAEEQISGIVQRVFTLPSLAAPRMVAFSSLDTGRGAHDICFHTGRVLASQVSGSVCLVDANLDSPALDQLAGIGQRPGLSDALASARPIKDFTTITAIKNLYVVSAGLATEECGPIVYEKLFPRFLELKKEFDYTLIVAPPIDGSGATVLLGKMAEGLILVLEANATKREIALVAKQTLENAKVNLIGAVLNNRTYPIPESIYRRL